MKKIKLKIKKYYIDNEKTQKLIRTLIDNGTLQNTMLRTEQNRTEQNRPALTERLKNRKNEKLQTWLLTDRGEKAEKRIDVARALKARDYKGLDNYGSNGVIEWKY